jgi:hypothetical protein
MAPKSRPASWGAKAQQRADARAIRILTGNRKLGRNIDVNMLAACVVDREGVGHGTAYAAAKKAFSEFDSLNGPGIPSPHG